MKKIILSCSVIAISLTGCTSYRHARFDPNTGAQVESTSLMAPFLTKTTIAGLKTRVTDAHTTDGAVKYTRSVGIDGIDAAVDAAGVQAVESLIGRALVESLRKSVVPVP